MRLRRVAALLIAGALLLTFNGVGFCASQTNPTTNHIPNQTPTHAIVAAPQGMDRKDIYTLVVSVIALALSLIATTISLRQKKYETERTLRAQLTDAIGKLNTVYESAIKLREENQDKWNDPIVLDFRSFYTGQKMFYARQAIYIAKQIPNLVSDNEYNSLARAFADADDDASALMYYEKAIKVAPEPYYKAINMRGYGRLLIRTNRIEEGRKQMTLALSLVNGHTDSEKWFRAETLQRWAQIEATQKGGDLSTHLFERALTEYSSISFEPRRREGLENLSNLRKSGTTAEDRNRK